MVCAQSWDAQMVAVMKLVTAKTAGAADNKTISEVIKAALMHKQ